MEYSLHLKHYEFLISELTMCWCHRTNFNWNYVMLGARRFLPNEFVSGVLASLRLFFFVVRVVGLVFLNFRAWDKFQERNSHGVDIHVLTMGCH